MHEPTRSLGKSPILDRRGTVSGISSMRAGRRVTYVLPPWMTTASLRIGAASVRHYEVER
jgi:hypothetical protein